MANEMKTAIGLMSGTSADGVDAALIRTDGETVLSTGPYHFVEYGRAARAGILDMMKEVKAAAGAEARHALARQIGPLVTDHHFKAVDELMARAGLLANEVDVVGFHGQTLFHDPSTGFTLQAGDAVDFARRLQVPVVYNFRGHDMAHGGQGAPLVPVYHRALVAKGGLSLPVAVVNIGGVANVSYIGRDEGLLAFDTGPGNVLIDEWIGLKTGARFDDRGALAARGRVDEAVLEEMLGQAYFTTMPPKSLDRYDFSLAPVAGLSVEDGAASLVEFTARTIARAADFFEAPPTRWVIVGGGVRNAFLMKRLQAHVDGPVVDAGVLDWSPGYVEAEAFGFLAVRHLYGLPLTFPGTTGVKVPLTGGELAQPQCG